MNESSVNIPGCLSNKSVMESIQIGVAEDIATVQGETMASLQARAGSIAEMECFIGVAQ
jgi:hypothetical protein